MKNTWDVSSLFNEQELKITKELIIKLQKEIIEYKGKVCKNINNFLQVLNKSNQLNELMDEIYIYHAHQEDIDLANSELAGAALQMNTFIHEVYNELAFITPEILQTDEKLLINYAEDSMLKNHKKEILELIEQKQYVLDKKSEEMLAQISEATSSSYDIYSTLTNAELKFEEVLDKDNQLNELTEAKWSIYSHSQDRVLRKNAFNSLFAGYEKYKQTITTIYISYLKTQKVFTQVRKYENPRQKALFNNQIDEKIYDNLISAVHEKMDYNHEYLKLRKECLDYDELHLYDVYAPIVELTKEEYSYLEAQQLIISAVKPLGEQYVNQIKDAFINESIDVYPAPAKRSGAYSGGSYTTKPYILLNYTNTLNDVFTLAHELGHSMHTKNTNLHQLYQNSHYKIFIAEIASTVNELLLFNDMYQKEEDITIKINLLTHNLEQFRTTVYRQTMFAEFESITSKMFFNNEVVNEEIFSKLYYDLNKKYYGDDVEIDELIKYEWLRIPHFYYNFYVYQYATSFCIATKIVKEILLKNECMIKNYLAFLKLGDSVQPIEAIKLLGIDITTSTPLVEALEEYHLQLEELKKLLQEKGV